MQRSIHGPCAKSVVLRTPLSTDSVSIVGDVQAGMDWLPIDRGDKCALIERLPLDMCDKPLLTLAM